MGKLVEVKELLQRIYANWKITIETILCVVGIAYFPIEYVLYGFVFSTVFGLGVVATTLHDYVSHEYVIPCNAFVGSIVLMLVAMYGGRSLQNNRNYHALHHTFTNTAKDPTRTILDSTSWLGFMFNIRSPVTIYSKTITETSNALKTPVWRIINKYAIQVHLTLIVLWLILLPMWSFYIFYIIPVVHNNIVSKYVDLRFHKSADRLAEDVPHLALLLGSSAWHNTHHKQWKVEFCGSGKWKYVNPQYWTIKVLFKPKEES